MAFNKLNSKKVILTEVGKEVHFYNSTQPTKNHYKLIIYVPKE
jgi:hypothetical protein